MQDPTARKKIRHRWNHRSPVHRGAVRMANKSLRQVPPAVLYRGIMARRRHVLPYSLVSDADCVVQVGAPSDTLLSGRSRGMALGLLTPHGQTVLVEPSTASIAHYERVVAELGATGIGFEQAALFSAARPAITLYEDREHPARNFIDGMANYSAEERKEFTAIEVPAKTLDQVWTERFNRRHLRLVSLTTNGAEEAILQGGIEALAHTDYLALAVTSEEVTTLAKDAGFELLGSDDRGFTYRRTQKSV